MEDAEIGFMAVVLLRLRPGIRLPACLLVPETEDDEMHLNCLKEEQADEKRDPCIVWIRSLTCDMGR